MTTATKPRTKNRCEIFERLIEGGMLTMGHGVPVETDNGWKIETTLGPAEVGAHTDDEGYWVRCTFQDVKRARKEVNCDKDSNWCFQMHGQLWTAAAAILEAIGFYRVV
jgi:hypothetical protein